MKPRKPKAAGKENGPKTVYLNTPIYQAGKVYASFLPRIKNISNLLESLLIKELRAKAAEFGIKLPKSLLCK